MKNLFFLLLLGTFLVPIHVRAQAWSGILLPTTAGGCTVGQTTSADRCAIDWTTAGVPGGIPSGSWGQSGSTITAAQAPCNSGTGDCTSTIQTALNSCGANHYVLLGAGTFLIDGSLSIPSNCALRGSGANQTILSAKGASGNVINLGGGSPNLINWPAISISSGAVAGSTSITLASSAAGSGIAVGSLVIVNEQNPSFVSIGGSEGSCTWCDGLWNGTRAIGQIELVTAVSGSTLTLSQPLFISYPNSPIVANIPPATVTQNAGVENLQVFANNTGYVANYAMSACAYCWVSGVEGNYADADHVHIDYSYHSEVVDSYFSNAFNHTPGDSDSDLAVRYFSTGNLVQNDIFERLHVSVMLEWAPSGNVIAYNYMFGNFDSGATNVVMSNLNTHGAHPMFNLLEGNVLSQFHPDDIWGSSSDNTTFRNWMMGTTFICNPTSGRGTVSCIGTNGWWAFQAARAADIDFLAKSYNMIGDVVGSSAMTGLIATDEGNSILSQVNMAVALCGPSPCGAASRVYETSAYAYSVGYGEASDDGTGGSAAGTGCDISPTPSYACHSLVPYSTLFLHGEYSDVTGTTNWSSGTTQTLPSSFYLPSKPTWWPASMPFPAVGPDVRSAEGPGGHIFSVTGANPAQNCYFNVMGGTNGAGSPLSFNASACYASSGVSTAPTAPSSLQAIVH